MPPVGTRNVLACRDTLAAGFAQRTAGMRPGATTLDDLLASVSARIWEGHPKILTRLDPLPLDQLHDDVVAMAWRDGAWDIQVLRHPPLSGAQLGAVNACMACEDEALLDELIAAAERGRLVTWSWRPMRGGPALRRKALAAKDTTLRADGARDGLPREGLRRPRLADRGGNETIVRLGIGPEAALRPPIVSRSRADTRATRQQRGYIVGLRRRLGRDGEPLPAALTRAQASAIIDQLLGDIT